MKTIEDFGKLLDNYSKENNDIQPKNKNLITIEYTVLLEAIIKLITNKEKLEDSSKKLNIIREVLSL